MNNPTTLPTPQPSPPSPQWMLLSHTPRSHNTAPKLVGGIPGDILIETPIRCLHINGAGLESAWWYKEV